MVVLFTPSTPQKNKTSESTLTTKQPSTSAASQILEAVSLKKLLVSSTGSDILWPIMLILKLQET